MPHNNRVSGSHALKTNDMWSNIIGHNPYAAEGENLAAATDTIAAEQGAHWQDIYVDTLHCSYKLYKYTNVNNVCTHQPPTFYSWPRCPTSPAATPAGRVSAVAWWDI
jgi:hypothetical protein